jgi:hypothetical protein
MLTIVIVSLTSLLGCSEYGINGEAGSGEGVDTGLTTETSTLYLEELCDGKDNDQDGLIDEGFEDFDADGIADCVDDACSTVLADAINKIDEECEGGVGVGTPPINPWNWTIEWQWTGGLVYATPSVGDLDLDGIPEVVINANGQLNVIDGSTGSLRFSVGSGIDDQSGTALGDIDGDGYGDIITSTGSCYSSHVVEAYNNMGIKLWSTSIGTACETYPVIQDLDGDGDIEVIVNEYILDGATGSVKHILAITGGNNWGAPVAADMDGDGVMEVILENRVYDNKGAFLWQCGDGGTGTFPHPVNIDADDNAELLVAAPNKMTLCDDTGTVLWTRPHSSYGSAIAVADFDGDGEQEFAFANYGNLTLIENDGTELWSTSISDYSGLAGCTSWDIDLDGVPEVVYADENDILVLHGATGTVVLRESSHGSVTLAETPAVADVDGDGHGELLYGSNSGMTGITVIGSADNDWPYSPPVYNQYGYYGGNVNTDLSIPLLPEPPWLYEANLFRGQPSAVYLSGSPNLQADITDVCIAACNLGGYAEVAVQIWNTGGNDVEDGTPVRLYGLDEGSRVLIDERPAPALATGESYEYQVSTRVLDMGEGLTVIIDEDEALAECSEKDNTGQWMDLPNCY